MQMAKWNGTKRQGKTDKSESRIQYKGPQSISYKQIFAGIPTTIISLLLYVYFRWVKFEEEVEEGGNRWSKPHVATLSLHSLFELRSMLLNGTICLDMSANNLDDITELLLDNMINSNMLTYDKKAHVKEAILKRHRHQYEGADKVHGENETKGEKSSGFLGSTASNLSKLPVVKSLAEIVSTSKGNAFGYTKHGRCFS